ncbi:MAG: protein kinase [Kiritimatiellae bacterium]|nr:protein kinase [Kiritimatiellia bacterium]
MELDLESLLASRPAEKKDSGRLRLGQIVGGWRVEAFLGSGRSAEVYRVTSTGFGGEGALKLLADTSERIASLFAREMEAVKSLSVPSIPRFLGSGEIDGRPWYAMEYLQPLFLPLDRSEVAPFAMALAKAVGELHAAGYVHRDLKPGNVLLRRSGDPVLIDLGLVRRIGERADDGAGTMGYAAPEQMLKGESSVRADVFALGKMLRAAGGKRLSHRLKSVVRRATHEDPEERYESAEAFAAAVRGLPLRQWALPAFAAIALCAAAVVYLETGRSAAEHRAPPPPAEEKHAAAEPEPLAPPAPRKKTFEEVLDCARRGDAKSQAMAAECYYHGKGVATNRAAAVAWYRRAAQAGNPGAQDSLGKCLLYGDGCEADPAEAVKWFTRAAEKEHPSAMGNLAFCHLNGKGVPRDDHKGFVWAKAAADMGHAPSQTLVGECYLSGRGVEMDRDFAEVWLHRAASKGNRRAQNLLEGL